MVFDITCTKRNLRGYLGTLYQLKARLNRKDVYAKVNKSYHRCAEFFSTVVDGYIVYSAMQFFGMTTPDSTPTVNKPQSNDSQSRGTLLKEKIEQLVNKYVLFKPQLEQSTVF